MPPAILINIDVVDLNRAVAFYAKLLDAKVGRRFGAAGVELVGASVPIFLLVKEEDIAASSASAERRRYRRHWTPVHLDFAVSDLDAAVAEALAAGASQDGPPETHAWGRMPIWQTPSDTASALFSFSGADMTRSPPPPLTKPHNPG